MSYRLAAALLLAVSIVARAQHVAVIPPRPPIDVVPACVILIEEHGQYGVMRPDGSLLLPCLYDGITFYEMSRPSGRERYFILNGASQQPSHQSPFASGKPVVFIHVETLPVGPLAERMSQLYTVDGRLIYEGQSADRWGDTWRFQDVRSLDLGQVPPPPLDAYAPYPAITGQPVMSLAVVGKKVPNVVDGGQRVTVHWAGGPAGPPASDGQPPMVPAHPTHVGIQDLVSQAAKRPGAAELMSYKGLNADRYARFYWLLKPGRPVILANTQSRRLQRISPELLRTKPGVTSWAAAGGLLDAPGERLPVRIATSLLHVAVWVDGHLSIYDDAFTVVGEADVPGIDAMLFSYDGELVFCYAEPDQSTGRSLSGRVVSLAGSLHPREIHVRMSYDYSQGKNTADGYLAGPLFVARDRDSTRLGLCEAAGDWVVEPAYSSIKVASDNQHYILNVDGRSSAVDRLGRAVQNAEHTMTDFAMFIDPATGTAIPQRIRCDRDGYIRINDGPPCHARGPGQLVTRTGRFLVFETERAHYDMLWSVYQVYDMQEASWLPICANLVNRLSPDILTVHGLGPLDGGWGHSRDRGRIGPDRTWLWYHDGQLGKRRPPQL